MQQENQLQSCCKNSLSSREVVARDLPHPTMLFNKEKQPYFLWEAEDPGTLRAAKLSGMTSLFDNDNDKSGRPRSARAASTGETLSFQGVGPVFARPARTGAPLRSGFTLIELLVVVLIIGILAAVAVPQYQRAVEKSRATQVFTIVKSLAEAQERYFLANGEYATSFDSFDIEIPGEDTSYNGYARRKTDDFDFGLNSAYSDRTIIALAQRWEKGQVHVGGKGLYAFIKVANDPNIYCNTRQDNPYGICKTLSRGQLSPTYSGWYIIRL